MTKIPFEILHFCETTNSGHNSNIPFLVLQVDGLLEGPSLIHSRVCISLRIVRPALRVVSVLLCAQPRRTSHFCQPKSLPLSSEASWSLHHPKLLRTCTIRSFFVLIPVFLRRSTKDEVSFLRRGPSAPTVAPRGISLFIGNELKPRTKLPAKA